MWDVHTPWTRSSELRPPISSRHICPRVLRPKPTWRPFCPGGTGQDQPDQRYEVLCCAVPVWNHPLPGQSDPPRPRRRLCGGTLADEASERTAWGVRPEEGRRWDRGLEASATLVHLGPPTSQAGEAQCWVLLCRSQDYATLILKVPWTVEWAPVRRQSPHPEAVGPQMRSALITGRLAIRQVPTSTHDSGDLIRIQYRGLKPTPWRRGLSGSPGQPDPVL